MLLRCEDIISRRTQDSVSVGVIGDETHVELISPLLIHPRHHIYVAQQQSIRQVDWDDAFLKDILSEVLSEGITSRLGSSSSLVSLLITGSSGAGKTHLLSTIEERLIINKEAEVIRFVCSIVALKRYQNGT